MFSGIPIKEYSFIEANKLIGFVIHTISIENLKDIKIYGIKILSWKYWKVG